MKKTLFLFLTGLLKKSYYYNNSSFTKLREANSASKLFTSFQILTNCFGALRVQLQPSSNWDPFPASLFFTGAAATRLAKNPY